MRKALILSVVGALSLAGCGGGGGGGGGDGGASVPYTSGSAFVTTLSTAFDAASYSVVDPASQTSVVDLPSQLDIVGTDNAAEVYGGKVYILNKYGLENITVLDPNDLSVAVTQFSVQRDGESAVNLQDIAFASETKAYVSRLADNDLLIVDPTDTGHEIQGAVDLSDFLDPADADGAVEAGPMVVVGDRLFVGLQRLNNFVADFDSLVAVIDTTTDELVDVNPATPEVDAITLTGRNPGSLFYDPASGKIVVSETGNYGVQDGGVELVDPETRQAEGFLVTEADLGGDVTYALTVGGATGYVVAGGFAGNDVAVFDAVDGGVLGALGLNSPFIPNLAVDGAGRLLVPDRSIDAPGVRIFDTGTDQELTGAPVDVGLPPNWVVVM